MVILQWSPHRIKVNCYSPFVTLTDKIIIKKILSYKKISQSDLLQMYTPETGTIYLEL